MSNASKIMAYLGVSVLSSFTFAVCWVVLMTLTLPETDMAHGQMPFQDPLVFPVMSVFAAVSAIAAWPFYLLFGWNLPPVKVGIVAGCVTLVFIFVATPFHAVLGWLGSYLVLLASLAVCRLMFTNASCNGKSPADTAQPTEEPTSSDVLYQ
jgi:hypothetical protein